MGKMDEGHDLEHDVVGVNRRHLIARSAMATAGLAGAGTLLAACGSSSAGSAGATGGGAKGQATVTIEYPQSGGSSIEFLKVVENGARLAAKDLGVTLNVRSSQTFDTIEQGRMVDEAVATKPDGIMTGIWDNSSMAKPMKAAVDAGIPVVVFNAGQDFWRPLGGLTYIGQDEYTVGVRAGAKMKQAGVQSVAILNHQVGAKVQDLRSRGFAKGFGGKTKEVGVNGTDPTASRNQIRQAIASGDFDALFALGQQSAEPALLALDDLGKAKTVKLASIDYSPAILTALADGKMLFASDQQQYLQGYYPVLLLAMLKRYGFHPTDPISTGPSYVTTENAKQLIALSAKGIR